MTVWKLPRIIIIAHLKMPLAKIETDYHLYPLLKVYAATDFLLNNEKKIFILL